jgi:hypothetical protein
MYNEHTMLELVPSFEEYQKAKKVVIAYENEQNRLEKIRLIEFRNELSIFFKNNNKLIINEFELTKDCNRYEIIPTNQLKTMKLIIHSLTILLAINKIIF